MRTTTAILLLVTTSFAAGAAQTVLYPGAWHITPVTWMNLAIGIAILIAWYVRDAKQHDRAPTYGMGFLIGGLAIVGVPLHLFATRPWRQAVRATLVALIVVAIMVSAWEAGAWAVSAIRS